MLYCYVEQGQIIEGPGRLPKSWRNIGALDKASPEQLLELGWLPFIDVKPEYNKDTQYITGSRVITADAVTMNNTVNDYSAEEIATRLESAKTPILNRINTEVNTYINQYYDPGTQQTFTAIYVKYNTQAVKDYLDPVLAWIESVMAYYYTQKATIVAAADLTALRAITWDFETFDETKPDASLQALMASLSE